MIKLKLTKEEIETIAAHIPGPLLDKHGNPKLDIYGRCPSCGEWDQPNGHDWEPPVHKDDCAAQQASLEYKIHRIVNIERIPDLCSDWLILVNCINKLETKSF